MSRRRVPRSCRRSSLKLVAIPEAVTRALGGKSGLGVHSCAAGDGGHAADAGGGRPTTRHKEIDPSEVSVAMMLMGSPRALCLRRSGNPRLNIRSPRRAILRDAVVLGQFRAALSRSLPALEVDLSGQCPNAEMASGRLIGLTGGQVDFVRAANRAPEGRSIIALQSTNRDRSQSRIVAPLCRRNQQADARGPTPIASSPSTASPSCAAAPRRGAPRRLSI